MVTKKSTNILKNGFNKVQKFIIKHKTPIVIILGLLIIYLSILFSTRNLDHFQDATEDATEDATADATEDACASLRSDLSVLQEEKQSLREQISNLENQVTTIEEECDETETKLILEKESLLKQLEEVNAKYADVTEQYNSLNEEYQALVNENKTLIGTKDQQITELQNRLNECNLKCTESFQDTENNQNGNTQTQAEEDNSSLIIQALRLDNESILRNSQLQAQMIRQLNINNTQNTKLRRLNNILFKKNI